MGETYIKTREDMVREYRGERRRKPENTGKNYFQIRLSIAALLFLLFFAAGELSFSYKGFNNQNIVAEITKNEDLSLLPEKIVSAFNNLN